MDISCFTKYQLQMLRLSHTAKELAVLFAISQSDVYSVFSDLGILPPPAFVKRWLEIEGLLLSGLRLSSLVCKLGHLKVAKYFSVSPSFVYNLFNCMNDSTCKGEDYELIKKTLYLLAAADDSDELNKLVEGIGSISLVERMYKTGLFHKHCLKSPSPENRNLNLGNHTSSIGRKMELLVLSLIGGVDMNLEHPHSRFDITHEKFGRINVKALNSKNGKWRFPFVKNCDYVAAVAMRNNDPEFVNIIPAALLPKTVTCDNRKDSTLFVLKQSLYL